MNDPAADGAPLEIACDESGYEGEKLIGTTTDVFAHGSVRMDTESASDTMAELRIRIRSPATEYKATHLLREKHRSVLLWLLGPSGPLAGNAHVYVVDKAFFVLRKVVDLLVDEDERATSMAAALYHEGRRAFRLDLWEAFLVSANNLMRDTDGLDVRSSVDSFFDMVDVLRLAAGDRVAEILGLLRRARARTNSFRAPMLDPLIPAIVGAVVFWGQGGRLVSIVHDQQNTLSVRRIAQLHELISKASRGPSSGRLAGLTLVDSGSDPRVQMADILAGVARKIASDELNDRGDAQLTALLRPYVDSFSSWGDDRSWSLLAGGTRYER